MSKEVLRGMLDTLYKLDIDYIQYAIIGLRGHIVIWDGNKMRAKPAPQFLDSVIMIERFTHD